MIKLKQLIFESNDNWNRWIKSMINTVQDTLIEDGHSFIDVGEAYDIIKTNFRADAPSIDIFDKACKEAIVILKNNKTIR